MRALFNLASVFSLIALVFFIVSLSTPEWTVFNKITTGSYANRLTVYYKEYAFSPFRYYDASTPYLSHDRYDLTGSLASSSEQGRLDTVRAFMIMTLVFSGLSCVSYLAVLSKGQGAYIAAVFSLIASIFGMVSMAIWTDVHSYLESHVMPSLMTGDIKAQRGFSLGMQITAWSLCFVAGVITIVAAKLPSLTKPANQESAEPRR